MFALALVGCFEQNEKAQTDVARVQRHIASEDAKAAAQADAPIVPRIIQVGTNKVLVFDVLTPRGLGFLDAERCIVWRDTAYKTSAISCPAREPRMVDLAQVER